MTSTFEHTMAAHCETGTISALLTHAGLPISEPMVLGIGGGIFFAYLNQRSQPFPTFVTRSKPGDIRKQIQKRLKINFQTHRFSNQLKARERLDELVSREIPVAAQVDMFYMDYIPPYMKAHFNGHFVTVIEKNNDSYTVSDCYYPQLAEVGIKSFEKGRFAGGQLAPKGFLFYPRTVPDNPDLSSAITGGIRHACGAMLKLPVPFIGVKGIRLFARKVMEWPQLARDIEHLSHEIMMIHIILEERGTGGAGFRFMYATFLQQAAKILKNSKLEKLSCDMMANGDRWREISLYVARIGKNRDLGQDALGRLSDMLLKRADEEQELFTRLARAVD
ncbi:MAG: BtrH N-terminal domain-containing protein [Chitinispirillaceae bacterium]